MKTIKESAKDYADNFFEERLGNCGARDGFIAGVEFAQRWIEAEQEKPNPYVPVLVKEQLENGVALGIYRYTPDGYWNGIAFNAANNNGVITHWRYIEIP